MERKKKKSSKKGSSTFAEPRCIYTRCRHYDHLSARDFFRCRRHRGHPDRPGRRHRDRPGRPGRRRSRRHRPFHERSTSPSAATPLT